MVNKKSKKLNVWISEKENDILENVINEHELKNVSEALRFIIKEFDNLKNQKFLMKEVLNEHEHSKKAWTDRVKWASTESEKNTILILDAINTMLFAKNVEGYVPASRYPAKAISESKKEYDEKMDHFKQAKHDRENRTKKRTYNFD